MVFSQEQVKEIVRGTLARFEGRRNTAEARAEIVKAINDALKGQPVPYHERDLIQASVETMVARFMEDFGG